MRLSGIVTSDEFLLKNFFRYAVGDVEWYIQVCSFNVKAYLSHCRLPHIGA